MPTLYLYDNYPGGIGLSEPLWHRQHELLARAHQLIRACACRAGCPACVGPILAAEEQSIGQQTSDSTPKQLADQVLGLLLDA
mgnify:CR=1 FL=1